MPQRPAIYARISSDRDGQQLGVRRQIDDCAALVARRGWPPALVYTDDDISAYRGKPRPAYRQLLAAIAAGEVDAVVVWHLDRLHRHPKELEAFFEVCAAAGIKDLASVSGDIDLATHDGQFLARILGAVAKKESDDKSRRIARKALELAQAGKIGGGGTRPYGYGDDRRTVIPAEARIIREVAARLLAGDSLRSVANDLNSRGIRSVTGREWQPQTLRRMILSARISGQREHRGEIVAQAEWPGVIPPQHTARLRALFADPDRRTNRAARRYLLKGLLRCGHCGATLQARPRGGGDRRYGCTKGPGQPGCGRTWILSESLEELISEAVLYRLDTPTLSARLARSPQTDPTEDAHAELLADQTQLDELASAYGDKALTLREYLVARKPIEGRIEASRRQISRQRGTSALDDYVHRPGALRAAWPTLTASRQHAIIAAILAHITVGGAVRGLNRFDPRRLNPVWRV
jgi:site-specific DNA recombinase